MIKITILLSNQRANLWIVVIEDMKLVGVKKKIPMDRVM